MKGIIFSVFNKLVEEKFGLKTWDKLLDDVKPASGGSYTASDTYDDKELFSLVGKLSEMVKTPINKLVKVFGEYTLSQLAKRYPLFFEGKNAKEFLLSIHDVVHVEVKKLYPDAELPHFSYEDPGAGKLVMLYQSKRKLCPLAEGLIEGTAKHYGILITNNHTKCMHKNSDHCRFELKFKEK